VAESRFADNSASLLATIFHHALSHRYANKYFENNLNKNGSREKRLVFKNE